MPLPKPKPNESREEFLKRCMANPTMNDEYPDGDQRYAVCNDLWKRRNEEMSMVNVSIKSAAGIFEPQQMQESELVKWFKENSDKEGIVQQGIIIYQSAILKRSDDGSIEWVMSDFSVDRDLERVDPEGWDLKNFKKNPIVLWSHEFMRPAIGKVDSPRVKDGQLIGRVRFSSKEVDPFAAMIEGKVREEIITAGSVGFQSKKIELIDDKDKPEKLVHRKQELYEFSIVNIPSNINALAESRDAEPDDSKLKALEDLLGKRIESLERQIRNMKKPSYIESLLKQDRRETSGIKHLLKKDSRQK